jgi:hypothetical protein
MKQFLLFAGPEGATENGVSGFVADFDCAVDALLFIVDCRVPAEWWHVLDIKSGEVVERHNVSTADGVIKFRPSDRIVGSQGVKLPRAVPAPNSADLNEVATDFRTVFTAGL